LKRCLRSRSTFNDPNRVSLQALSRQLPLRLIELAIPYSQSTFLKSRSSPTRMPRASNSFQIRGQPYLLVETL
jgi:hypothetical protein